MRNLRLYYGIDSPQLVPQRGAGAEGARPPLSLQVRTQPSNKTGGAANKSCLYNSSKEACKSKSNSSYAHYGSTTSTSPEGAGLLWIPL